MFGFAWGGLDLDCYSDVTIITVPFSYSKICELASKRIQQIRIIKLFWY